jgi:uncharacterized protein
MRPSLVFSALALAAATSAPTLVQAQAHAPPAGETAPRVIHVTADAAVQRVPDRAVIHLAVETLAPTAREATTANAQAMDRVLAAVRNVGIPDARIRTTRIELHPRYDSSRRPDAGPPAIVGYQATNQVIVQVDDLDRVGRVVDAAVTAGANRVTGIAFEIRDPDPAYHEALRLAVARARAEAQVLADALGESLGPALQVSTGSRPAPLMGREFARMEMDMAAAAPPVQPGELDVRAMVSITYRIGS